MKLLSRKELASALKISVSTFKRRESEWGLTRARTRLTMNPVCYDLALAERELRRRNIIGSSF